MDELNCEMDGWNWQMDAMFSSICYFLVLYSTREGNVRVQMIKVIRLSLHIGSSCLWVYSQC